MTEAFLQYVWQHQLICTDKLYTVDNEPISIIKLGMFNTNSGPDFLNAKIKIGETLWAGDIELHIKSSDWNVHQHHTNKAYNSVILHVVASYDKDVFCENGHKIPTLILPILPRITYNYMKISDVKTGIRCGKHLKDIDSFRISMYIERLVAERFESKARHIFELYAANTNDWEETLYQQLARNFGFQKNGDAFEHLAKSLPFHILEKHHDCLFQIEALLFGQANIFSTTPDDYESTLIKEYGFLQKKYNLIPISSTEWKFARMRPYNFPTIRIAQFAKLIYSTQHFVSQIIDLQSIQQIFNLTNVTTNEYWETHYSFGKISPKHNTTLGKQAVESIAINTIVPFLFAYGKSHSDEKLKQKAYDFLIELTPEKNSIIQQWNDCGMKTKNALETQGLIQLFNNYCEMGNCIHCSLGHIVLNRKDVH